MSYWTQLLASMGFDQAAQSRVAGVAPGLASGQLAKGFYGCTSLASADRTAFERRFAVWLDEVLTGPWDEAMWERHVEHGRRHCEAGVSESELFAALSWLRCNLAKTAFGHEQGDIETCLALAVLIDMEMACMSRGYHLDRVSRLAESLEQARQAQLEHKEAVDRLGALASTVAHELRNPLTSISTTLQVIGASFPDEDRRQVITERLVDEVFRLNQLVTDLLDYSKRSVASFRAMAPAELVEHAATVTGVDMEIVEHDPVPRIWCDPNMLLQILTNLITNAEAVSANVRIHLGPGPQLVVADDGRGIDPEAREQLFEPFFTTKTKGTGLGLSIAKRLAEAQGGALELLEGAESERYGTGAAFRLRLDEAHEGDQQAAVEVLAAEGVG